MLLWRHGGGEGGDLDVYGGGVGGVLESKTLCGDLGLEVGTV